LHVVRIADFQGGHLLLSQAAAFLAANRGNREVSRRLMQPPRQRSARVQFQSVPCQSDENALSYLFGEARVTQNSESGRIDQIDMAVQ